MDRYSYRTEFYKYSEVTIITPEKYEGMNLKVILTDYNENIIKVLLYGKILYYEKELKVIIFFDELNLNTGPYYIIAFWGDSCKVKKKFFLIRN